MRSPQSGTAHLMWGKTGGLRSPTEPVHRNVEPPRVFGVGIRRYLLGNLCPPHRSHGGFPVPLPLAVMITDPWIVTLGVFGLLVALGATSGVINDRLWISEPLACALAGIALGPLYLGLLRIDPGASDADAALLREAARVTLSIAVTGAAMRLPAYWLRQNWRALAVALGPGMLLMAAAGALVGGLLALPWIACVLIGAAIAPTDPVLSAPILTGQLARNAVPDALRHAMTAESGINDGLALPFVMVPILLLQQAPGAAMQDWLMHVILWQVGVAVVVGCATGWLTSKGLEWARRHARDLPRPEHAIRAPARERRLNIGYVSPNFQHHAVAWAIEPVLAAHDRRAFRTFFYSTVANPDAVTRRFMALCDEWRDIRAMSDDMAARLVRQDHIDILVDLAGHTGGGRPLLFARKPAPVQVNWQGYPNTTGLVEMDYRITDACADPEGEADRHHTEKLVRLATGFFCYAPPADAPEPGEPPSLPPPPQAASNAAAAIAAAVGRMGESESGSTVCGAKFSGSVASMHWPLLVKACRCRPVPSLP